MKNKVETENGFPQKPASQPQAPLWVAPLSSIQVMSIGEFTEVNAFPGVDSSSPTTHS